VAILGIVELVIFLLHKYYSGLNVAQEKVFADVHFTLFFTALFNAVQSCIAAFFITRRSHSLWVMPEYQDAGHYVEIREEFDRINKELLSMKGGTESISDDGKDDANQTMSATQRIFRRCTTDDMDNITTEMKYMLNNIKAIWRSIIQFTRYPRLSYRYHDLLVQVKFHELKYHFIQANKLPITLEVSHYLKRCELRILQRMVHINTSTWLILTACMNLLYFFMGVVVFVTDGDLNTSGQILSALFFVSMFSFVFVSLILWNKVTWIFYSIMHQKFDSDPGLDEAMAFSDTNTCSRFNQKSLFWGDNPNYVTIVIQFLQFGFATALSILLVFWSDIAPKAGNSGIPAIYYVLSVLLCYVCFIYIVAHVMPRFTLCSSIGQMVNQKELHETVARHRLKEAQRQQLRELTERNLQKSLMKEDATSFFQMMGLLTGIVPRERSAGSTAKPELMKELISISTSKLRDVLPDDEKKALTARDSQILDRRSRRKNLSDG
jgi:hypothetical protein